MERGTGGLCGGVLVGTLLSQGLGGGLELLGVTPSSLCRALPLLLCLTFLHLGFLNCKIS